MKILFTPLLSLVVLCFCVNNISAQENPTNKSATLSLAVSPPQSAIIYINGEKKDSLKFLLSDNEYHVLKVEADGYLPYERKIYLRKNAAKRINISLKKKKVVYIEPRIGYSSLSGFGGVEVQYGNFAIDVGYGPIELNSFQTETYGYLTNDGVSSSNMISNGDGSTINELCYGVKYYFRQYTHSWWLGLFYEQGSDSGSDSTINYFTKNETNLIRYNRKATSKGLVMGYRWRWANRINLSLGLGISQIDDKVTFNLNDKVTYSVDELDDVDDSRYLPAGELTFGVNF